MQNQLQEGGATGLLVEQLTKLEDVRHLDRNNPRFVSWRDTTMMLLQKFLPPDSPHLVTFRGLDFRAWRAIRRLPYGYRGPKPAIGVSRQDKARFERDCDTAEECIKAALEGIRVFGVHTERAKSTTKEGGELHQTFNSPVTIHNQAIALGSSTLSIGQMGDTRAGLKEIAVLLDRSMELTGRQKLEGLEAIDGIALETKKPADRWDWKSIFDYGEKLTSIVNKATDIAMKLAPHIPALTLLMDEATKKLHGG